MKKILILTTFIPLMTACKKDNPSVPATRTYRMGMQNSAPRYDDFNLVLETLALWIPRADAAIITTEVPWDSLYNGVTPQQYVLNNYSGLVRYYRQHDLLLWVYIDPANGLDRSSDSETLKALGKSMTDPDVQKKYRRFVVVMDSLLKPDHLGVALETNLIRLASPAALYNSIVKASNDAVADVKAAGSTARLSVSVQAEVAWGEISGSSGYAGIDQDFIDFPFIQELGVSSYPYFYFDKPEDLPDNYYSKLVDGKSLKVFVSEGGWSSESFTLLNGTPVASAPDLQRRYIIRQGQLLDNASSIAWFQLTFTDIDDAAITGFVNPTIKYFQYLGLVDKNLTPRPSLAAWDDIFNRPLRN